MAAGSGPVSILDIVTQSYFLVKKKEGFGWGSLPYGGIVGVTWGRDAEEG